MRLCALALLFYRGVIGQEIDTINFRGPNAHGSLLDRAESEQERREFLALGKTRDAKERRALAEAFQSHHPQSWLLSGVFEIAASASLELNDFGRALEEGRMSLRLLPENAPLLVALAQIEIAMGHTSDAARDARDALLWLSMFTTPAGVKQADWERASQTIEQAARKVIAQAGGRPPPAEPSRRPQGRLKFAGSDACKSCHAAEYESWGKTGMAKMLRPLSEAVVLGDFSHAIEFREQSGAVTIHSDVAGRPVFEFTQHGSGLKRFRVDFVIGSKWQQAYATRLADDRIFVFPIQYNRIQQKWVNYWAAIDPPSSERADIGAFPHLSPATNYQRNCASCHTSQLRLARLDDQTMEKAAFREPGINCEMCHGPCAAHAASMSSGSPGATDASSPPLRFARLDHVDATLICGQCHRQSAQRNLGSNGEMNYTQEEPWFDRLLSQPFTEFGKRAFYKDGRFRETTFIGESFLRSACFRRGTAQCASCHDVHPRGGGENPASLKFLEHPDQMCVQCHTSVGAQSVNHTHHPPESAGARCVACHMPRIMNSLLFQARSHQIDDIPRADLTARFGQSESPNACLTCHAEKDISWVARQLENWKTVKTINTANASNRSGSTPKPKF